MQQVLNSPDLQYHIDRHGDHFVREVKLDQIIHAVHDGNTRPSGTWSKKGSHLLIDYTCCVPGPAGGNTSYQVILTLSQICIRGCCLPTLEDITQISLR